MKPITRQEFRPNAAGILFCVALAVTLLVQIVLSAALPAVTMQWCYSFLAPFLYLVVVFVGGRVDGTDVFAALGLRRVPHWWQCLLTVALSLACIVAFLPLATWVQQLFGLMGYHSGPSYANYTDSWGNMVLGLFGLALMPALGEEALCRGLAFGGFRQKGTYYGILMSALLFAMLHGSPVQLIHQFLIGVIMALLVHMTRTIWVSVLFHFCNNAFVILYEFTYTQAGWTYTIPWWVLLIMFLLGLPIVVLLMVAYCRLTRSRTPEQQGSLTFVGERLPFMGRVRRVMDVHGEYLPYVKGHQQMFGMYAAFAIVAMLWLISTIAGWVA